MRVAEFHTYFVGSDEWGFSVWAHNSLCAEQVVEALRDVGIEITANDPIVAKIIAAYDNPYAGSTAARDLVKHIAGVNAKQAKKAVEFLNAANETRMSLARMLELAAEKAAEEEEARIAGFYAPSGHLKAETASELAINGFRIKAPPSD